jgi:predicted esterase
MPNQISANLGFQHVFKPGTSARTLLLLHGTGGDEHDLLSLGAGLDPQANLLSPRGQVLENGMPRFFRRLAMGVFDIEDLKYRTAELAEFIRAAAREYQFDPSQVIAAGYSNGANIAASLMLLRPEVLAGGILLRPMIPLTPEQPPDLHGHGVFIAGGRRDPIVRPEETERLAKLLQGYGAEVSLHWSDQGHELNPVELQAARAWLTRVPSRVPNRVL